MCFQASQHGPSFLVGEVDLVATVVACAAPLVMNHEGRVAKPAHVSLVNRAGQERSCIIHTYIVCTRVAVGIPTFSGSGTRKMGAPSDLEKHAHRKLPLRSQSVRRRT